MIHDDHPMLISLYEALVSVGCPEEMALAAACEVQARPGAPTRTVREHRRLRLQRDSETLTLQRELAHARPRLRQLEKDLATTVAELKRLRGDDLSDLHLGAPPH